MVWKGRVMRKKIEFKKLEGAIVILQEKRKSLYSWLTEIKGFVCFIIDEDCQLPIYYLIPELWIINQCFNA